MEETLAFSIIIIIIRTIRSRSVLFSSDNAGLLSLSEFHKISGMKIILDIGAEDSILCYIVLQLQQFSFALFPSFPHIF